MMDAGAVAWKEWRELLGERGLRGKQGILVFVAAFGIVLPLMNGPRWITSPVNALTWSWVPMFLVTTVIADAFAGERERHTLETLLASRLSERAILFGKIGAAIGYAGTQTAASLILGLVAVNLANPRGGLLLYPLPVVVAICVLGLLGAVFVAAVGVMISLRAATVRQAQQTLGAAIIVLLILPMAVAHLVPSAWTHDMMASAVSAAQLAVVGVAAFAALDVGVVALAILRFRRARLIAE